MVCFFIPYEIVHFFQENVCLYDMSKIVSSISFKGIYKNCYTTITGTSSNLWNS